MNNIILLILSFTIISNAYTQENTANQWFFGNNASVDFRTGIPIANTYGALNTGDGPSTIGDKFGNLLFYTGGEDVYNRNHQIMPNGSGLMGHYSAAQSSIIVPHPGSDSLFYIFTVDAIENHLQNGLRYSIVDMSLDGGLGDINSTKNILLETPVTEKLLAILHSNNTNIWVVAHRWNSDEFVAYEITPTGISTTPVVSALGSVHQGGYSSDSYINGWTNAGGNMKANMSGDKIALGIFRMDIFELFDFNKTTGVLSNCYSSAPNYSDNSGVEFSPDGTKLYGSRTTYKKIYQFDITQTNPFNNPSLITSTSLEPSDLQIGPNGKIYVAEYTKNYLSVIHYPNELGLNCNYESQAVYLEGKTCRRGLPALYYFKGFQFITGSEVDTSICEGDSIFLENNYQTTTGTYYDTLNSSLGWDSIINTNLLILNMPPSPVISAFPTYLISTPATNYQWYLNGILLTGETNQIYQPIVSGNYQVGVDNGNGCISMSDVYYFEYVGIEEINNDFKIYPNPTNGIININSNCVENIDILNLHGKIIYNGKDNIIDLGNHPKGVYILRIITDKYTKVEKLVIN